MQGYACAALKLIRRGWKTIFLFEIIYRFFSAYIVFPLCKALFNATLRASGLYCLTQENIVRCVTNPLMLLCTAVIAAAFALTSMLEISGLITSLHMTHSDRTPGVLPVIGEGLRDVRRLLQPRNLPLLGITAFLLPLIQLPTETSPLRLIGLPWKSLRDYALEFPYILIPIAYVCLVALLLGAAMCVYQRYVLEDVSFRKAYRTSRSAGHSRYVRRLLSLCAWLALVLAATFGGAFLLNRGTSALLGGAEVEHIVRYQIRLVVNAALSFIKSSFPIVAVYAYISAAYYDSKQALGEPVPAPRLPQRSDAARHNAIVFSTIAVLALSVVLLFDSVLRPALVRLDALNLLPQQVTLVIAHRGYIEGDADENTLPAFLSASRAGADYIELDVQQTSDGVVIVAHDASFARVFGDRRKVWETTYDETRALSARNSGDAPPTLHEVIALCDPHANLLIELKDNGHNPDLPQAVYDILEEYDCFDRCLIQSSSYRMLEQFKMLSPETRCGYILSFALGDYLTLNAADFFTIDMNFVTEDVVQAVHRVGKELYAWTVNDESQALQLRSLGVDGIITDDTPMIKSTLIDSIPTVLEEILVEPLEDALLSDEAPSVDEPES